MRSATSAVGSSGQRAHDSKSDFDLSAFRCTRVDDEAQEVATVVSIGAG